MKQYAAFICLVFAIGCSKPKDVYVPINAAIMADFNFQPGTYWIFYDSVNGVTDSYYVTSNEATMITKSDADKRLRYSDRNTYNYGHAEISVTKKQTNPLLTHDTPRTFKYGLATGSIQILLSAPPVPGSTPTFFFEYPYAGNQKILSSYLVNGTTFNNVAELKTATYWQKDGQPFYYDTSYVSPGIGIIKMNLHGSNDSLRASWQLQRYNIVM